MLDISGYQDEGLAKEKKCMRMNSFIHMGFVSDCWIWASFYLCDVWIWSLLDGVFCSPDWLRTYYLIVLALSFWSSCVCPHPKSRDYRNTRTYLTPFMMFLIFAGFANKLRPWDQRQGSLSPWIIYIWLGSSGIWTMVKVKPWMFL